MTEIALLFGAVALAIGCLSLATRLDLVLFESRFAFSLRTLMIAVTLGCALAAFVGWVHRASTKGSMAPPPLLAGYVHTDPLGYLHTDALIVAAILLGLWLDFRRSETKTRRPPEKPRARWWRYQNQEPPSST